MNQETIHRIYQIGAVLALVLFVAMLIDHFANDAALLLPLAIVFGLIALVMVVMLFVQPTTQPVKTTAPATTTPVREDYPGDVHEVVDLEGIGPTYAERLHAIGIQNTQQLLFTDDKTLAKATGTHEKTVRNWKSMAQLAKVNGIGPQYAEALTRGGVDGIEGLRNGDVGNMTRMVNAYLDGLDSTVVGQRISEKRMTTWQANAKQMRKVPIDMDEVTVMPLASKAARADAAPA